MEVENCLNLENLNNIVDYIHMKTGIRIEKYSWYYRILLPYVEIKSVYLSSPQLLNGQYLEQFRTTVASLKKELTFLNKNIKPFIKDEEDKSINMEIKRKMKVISIIIDYYNNLYKFIYSNPELHRYGNEEQQIVESIIDNSDILPVVMLNHKCYNYVKPRSENIYLTPCPFHKTSNTPTFTIIENKGKWECNDCMDNGNIIGYVRQAYNMSYDDAIDTLARAFDIELPNIKTNEDKELVIAIKKMLLNDRYLRLVEKSIKRSEICKKDMTRDEIILRYNYHNIRK